MNAPVKATVNATVWGYNLPQNIIGSHEMFYEIHVLTSHIELDRKQLQFDI